VADVADLEYEVKEVDIGNVVDLVQLAMCVEIV